MGQKSNMFSNIIGAHVEGQATLPGMRKNSPHTNRDKPRGLPRVLGNEGTIVAGP